MNDNRSARIGRWFAALEPRFWLNLAFLMGLVMLLQVAPILAGVLFLLALFTFYL